MVTATCSRHQASKRSSGRVSSLEMRGAGKQYGAQKLYLACATSSDRAASPDAEKRERPARIPHKRGKAWARWQISINVVTEGPGRPRFKSESARSLRQQRWRGQRLRTWAAVLLTDHTAGKGACNKMSGCGGGRGRDGLVSGRSADQQGKGGRGRGLGGRDWLVGGHSAGLTIDTFSRAHNRHIQQGSQSTHSAGLTIDTGNPSQGIA